jgi:Putative beta-barrel porin 2
MMSCVFRNIHVRMAAAMPIALFVCNGAVAQQPAPPASDHAQQLDVELTGGVSYSDNIHRDAVNEETGVISRAGISLDYDQRSRRIDSDVDVDLSYENYSKDAFEDGAVGGVDASLDFSIVPERFLWSFQENFGQITTDPFAATTPDNREDINYFTTGPDFLMQLGSATSLRVAARFSDTQYEISPTDGQQLGGVLSLARQLSGESKLSLVLDGNKFEFDDEQANTDYERYSAYLSYQVKGARTDLSVDGGYSRLEIGDEVPDGPLARVTASRQMSTAAKLTLSVGTLFSDSGDLFRDGQDQLGASMETSQVVATSDPFVNNFASLGYDFDRNRTSFGFGVEFEEERYETETDLDRNLITWNGHFRRQLSAIFAVSVTAELIQEDFENVDFSDDELRASAYLNWTLGRRLALRFQYDHFDRDSTRAVTEYAENRGSVFLIWSPTQ